MGSHKRSFIGTSISLTALLIILLQAAIGFVFHKIIGYFWDALNLDRYVKPWFVKEENTPEE